MPSAAEIRQQVTEQIASALEQNLPPWRRPWASGRPAGRHRNAITDRTYSGVNPLLLQLHNLKHGFSSPCWATYEQWKSVGCQVRKRPPHISAGEWAAKIVFYKPVTRSVVSDAGEKNDDTFFVLRTWTVFNSEQVDGEAAGNFGAASPDDSRPQFDAAENLIQASGAVVHHGGDRACYSRPFPDGTWPRHTAGDSIRLPERRNFTEIGAYYETVFHELAHWSEVRLGWDHAQAGYAAGELVAEIASCYVSTELSVPQGESLENHARYVKDWLREMKADSTYIFKAATQASKVADFLLAFAHQDSSNDHESSEQPSEVA